MKQLFGVLLLFTLIPFAQADDVSSGCGTGKLVAPKNTLFSTTTAGSVDYLVPSRPSATTSGTSGCKKHDLVLEKKMQEHYVSANIELIKVDVATGSGEYVTGLARAFGCSDSVSDEFAHFMQSNYQELFSSENPTNKTIKTIDGLILKNQSLSKNCPTRA